MFRIRHRISVVVGVCFSLLFLLFFGYWNEHRRYGMDNILSIHVMKSEVDLPNTYISDESGEFDKTDEKTLTSLDNISENLLTSSNYTDVDELTSSMNTKDSKLTSSNNNEVGNLTSSINTEDSKLTSSMNTVNSQLMSINNTEDSKLTSSNNNEVGNLTSSINTEGSKLTSSMNTEESKLTSSNNNEVGNLTSSINTEDSKLTSMKNTEDSKLTSIKNTEDSKLTSSKKSENDIFASTIYNTDQKSELSKKLESAKEKDTKLILINTYMRSGSTFLGKVIGHRDDTFFFYEPLHRVLTYQYTKGSLLCNYLKPDCSFLAGNLGMVLPYLSDVYNCKLHVDKLTYRLHTSHASGPQWSVFNECKKEKRSNQECLSRVEQNCKKQKYRVTKVLRLSLEDAALLLAKFPNMVIVHLFRDPRGIINSHLYTGWYPVHDNSRNALINDIRSQCQRLRDDITIGETLVKLYPDRVKLVHYEDIDENIDKVKTLYKYIGMDFENANKDLLHYLLNRKTAQVNFLTGPFHYRTTLPYTYVKIIDEECAFVLHKLGLRVYKTEEELRNKNFNPIKNRLTFTL